MMISIHNAKTHQVIANFANLAAVVNGLPIIAIGLRHNSQIYLHDGRQVFAAYQVDEDEAEGVREIPWVFFSQFRQKGKDARNAIGLLSAS